MNRHPLERSGLAALSDLTTQTHREILEVLEKAQFEFLSKQELFRSPEYFWPANALHTWSRIWEYPYVYYHLRNWHSGWKSGRIPVVADVGCGVTFFPFPLARLGCHLICADPDPICEKDLNRAILNIPQSPGKMDFRRIDSTSLPFESQECDAVYCISVLEHIPDFTITVQEIARILKPGGVFLLTIDLDLQSNSEISVGRYSGLMDAIFKSFCYHSPDSTIHPGDLLDSRKGPYALSQQYRWGKRWSLVKNEVIKPLFGLKPGSWAPPHLAVQGFSLRRLPDC
jgi:2-polyprenyl-3-methyl-5-hydroxy-6-metoxy-1,4-benzoquinol methylase